MGSVDEIVTISFGADAQALARYAGSEAVRPALEKACSVVYPGAREIRFEVEQSEEQPGEPNRGLLAEAEGDPGVVLAVEIIGGEVVAARSDGGS